MAEKIITPDQHEIVVKKAKIWTPAQIILTIVIILFSLTCLLPFVNVAAVSFSSKSAILRGDVSFWPVDFETTAYQAIFSDKSMTRSLVFTIIITVVYTLFSMIMTILMAYPLTKKRLRGRNFFSFLALFTMYFSGGIIPHYLNIKELGLMDSPWALILPGMLSTYNMIILKSFFQTLPNELEEAAIIDGANDFQVLLKVYLPLSMASLATLTLFYAVGKWNSFQDALYYIQTKAYQPLQLKLYHIIKGSQAVDVAALEGGASTVATSVSESIEPASIIFATLPILVVYPFVQRYFVAGVTIGAVKG
ncbi:carbohydrate ABC transporter permease [Aristaeella hokkaidonensis]|uniref:carbohydrate ABC transporter permease n=1 Tax=Aristaeella hokkaidonensis TaxID=3046382 RepID=UPI000B675737|nr:carbohydrate ABC transporter permease [Aristaeella hokkaidonensis]MBQ6289920.1 carbohydrate ABC transporter permease [Clostridia bacterium]SNT93218.1 carbohydrate ABC transporter membrane protein 2, CUT1 family [Aristaeella hokkaidonensis]